MVQRQDMTRPCLNQETLPGRVQEAPQELSPATLPTHLKHIGNSIIFPLKDLFSKWQWTLWQRMFLDTLVWRAFQLYSIYWCFSACGEVRYWNKIKMFSPQHVSAKSSSYQFFVFQLVSSDSLPTFSTVARTRGWASKRIKSSNTEVPSRSPNRCSPSEWYIEQNIFTKTRSGWKLLKIHPLCFWIHLWLDYTCRYT